MGRPLCREKTGMKKGPWSPEEDLLLVSYVQEHGARNWHAIPANTGLMRCSKSCRLRWTNYLRPGIKRGNFSDQEEKLIIELQALLGNRWSAIASYMPDRTDNDIKNYWNTHLKKKLAKTGTKGQWEWRLQMDFHTARQVFQEAISMDTTPSAIKLEPPPLPLAPLPEPTINPALYAYNIENIACLLELEGWTHLSASRKVSAESSSTTGGSGSHGGTACTLLGFTKTTKVDGVGAAGPKPLSSFPMLESWVFDDGMGHDDVGRMSSPLADPCEFF